MRVRVGLSVTLVCALAFSTALTANGALESRQAAATQAAPTGLAAAADQQFTADGVSLRYRDFGRGEPMVLIHGYSAALESLTGIANLLPADHRIVALDVRGFGKSSKFAEPARFGQLMVDDVVRLMDHLKLPRAHLVGHSMGALIAANVAARYPERVSSATLVAGPFYPDKATFTRATNRWLADLESGKGLVNFAQWLFPKLDAKMAAGTNLQLMKTNDQPSLIAVMRSLPELAIAGFKTTRVPSLLAVGTGDPLHPLSVEFAKTSTGARLIEAEGADHITVLANPLLHGAMREMLKSSGVTAKTPRD